MYMDVVKTERLVTCFTIKMNVPVVMVAGTIVGTKLIVEETTAIFKRMNNIVFEEEREYTKNARLVHVRHCRL